MNKIWSIIILSIMFQSLYVNQLTLFSSTNQIIKINYLTSNSQNNIKNFCSDEIEVISSNFEKVGDQRDFWYMNWEIESYEQAHATLLSVGNYCYVYIQNESIEILGQEEAFEICDIVRDEFDGTIYPTNYELIGNPDGILGDIDGDPHITIFLAEDSAAYYSPINENINNPYSNRREMVYTFSRPGIFEILRDVCHETNHLFLFNYDLNEAVFIYEGLAEYSKYYAGYLSNSSFLRNGMTENTSISVTYFADDPYLSLFFFDEDEPVGGYGSYGISYLFIFYLAEKYGLQIIKDISVDGLYDGPESIEVALANNGYNLSFNELFLDFITACTIDKLSIYYGKYGFVNADFKIAITNIVSEFPAVSKDVKHRYYGIVAEKILGISDEFTLEIETPDYPRSLGVVILILDDNGWNITKLILTGDGSETLIHCNGLNINTVFLITSLIKERTPPSIYSFMSCPYSTLDIGVLQGHIYPVTDKTNYLFLLPFSALLVTIIIFQKKLLKKLFHS